MKVTADGLLFTCQTAPRASYQWGVIELSAAHVPFDNALFFKTQREARSYAGAKAYGYRKLLRDGQAPDFGGFIIGKHV